MKPLALTIVFLFTVAIAAEEKLPTFQVENMNSPVSLDSNSQTPNPWFVTSGNISETQITNLDRKTFSELIWKPISVPGNPIKEWEEFKGKKPVILGKWILLPKKNYGNLSIRLGVINDRDRVYWNGQKIGETGIWDSESPQAYDKIRIYQIPNQFIKYGEPNLLLIHVQPYFDYTIGIEQDTTSIGLSGQILRKFYIDEYTKLLFLTVYVTVGGYFLFLFIRRRRESENLFFALFSFGLVIYNLLRNQIKYEFGISFLTMKQIEYCIIITLLPFMFHFIRKLFVFRYHLIYKILDSIHLSFIIIYLFSRNIEFYNFLMTKVIQPLWLPYALIILYFLIVRMKEGNRKAYVIFIGILFVIISSVTDILSTRGIIIFPRLLGYAFLAFEICLAIVLANSFVKLNEEVEDLNKNLEKKVIERTDALNQTLSEVNILKDQQDGDYFLTSLLINPLARNDNRSQKVETEFFTKQKKVFEFRGTKTEIGGDICISNNIYIADKTYVVFLNGDAMGKSIQGAGGALVLGVVFHAVVTRTKADEMEPNLSPEIWLRDLFLELQSTFESFDGSMLTSLVLGLIDEDSGFLYYINAEHPWTILYRDKKASFIENELWLRKLGFPKNEKNFQIKTFQLYPDDILICGSDGRDDIDLSKDNDPTNRIINEDHNQILSFVQDSNADLKTIVNKIETFGTITDDLTFIKIVYKGKEMSRLSESELVKFHKAKDFSRKNEFDKAKDILLELQKTVSNNYLLPSLLGKIYFRQKDWRNAIFYLKKAISIRPQGDDLFLMLTLAFFKLNEYTQALPWAERLRVRNPKHHKNNVNLIYLYSKTNNDRKAISLLNQSLREFPENKDFLKLAKQIYE